MDLGKKIQQVLKHYPSVNVHGLGAFKKVHQASSFDEQHNVFLPPIDYVEFDDRYQDGLDLAEYLRQENEISRTDAQELVAREVAFIVSNINEHGKAHIPQLGDLLTYGDGYVFRAIDLSSFVFEPISNIEQPVRKTETVEEPVVPVTPKEESAAELNDSEEIADANVEPENRVEEVEISPNVDEPAPEEHHLEEEVAPIPLEETVTLTEEEPINQGITLVEPSPADEVWKSHVDAPELLGDVVEKTESESKISKEEVEVIEDVEPTAAVPVEPVPSLEETDLVERENIQEKDVEEVEAEEETKFSVDEPTEMEAVSHGPRRDAPVQEAPPLIQNKYQANRYGEVQESSIPPTLIPNNEEPDYTYASEYVEDNNRSQKIWYILAAVVALSIIGALWYVTRPVSLYSNVSELDGEDEMDVPYQINEDEYRIPAATTDVVDTSSVLQERPDTANRTTQTAVTPPSGAAIQPIIPANHHWYIVIGSRLPLDDAQEMVAEFNKKGQPRVRLIPGRGTDSPATVIWDSYVSKEKADSALRLVRKDFVADAWHKAVKK